MNVLYFGIHYCIFRGSKSMTQLNMQDAEDPRECFLAQLARNSMLDCFQYVVCIASHQDQYAPFRSARIEVINYLSS